MTDTKPIEQMGRTADHRAEALGWLAERVRWERLLDELRGIAADEPQELHERAA